MKLIIIIRTFGIALSFPASLARLDKTVWWMLKAVWRHWVHMPYNKRNLGYKQKSFNECHSPSKGVTKNIWVHQKQKKYVVALKKKKNQLQGSLFLCFLLFSTFGNSRARRVTWLLVYFAVFKFLPFPLHLNYPYFPLQVFFRSPLSCSH